MSHRLFHWDNRPKAVSMQLTGKVYMSFVVFYRKNKLLIMIRLSSSRSVIKH